MKVASIAKNIIFQYGVEPDQVTAAAMATYAHRTHLVSELNNLNKQIEDLQVKLNVLRKYRKLKVYAEEMKKLKGGAAKKYRNNNTDELNEYGEIRKQVLELYPSGHIPTVENLEKQISTMRETLSQKDAEYRQADKKALELSDAARTIEDYLRQEQSRNQQQKRKRNDLE